MNHSHPAGASNEWYLTHMHDDHYVAADPTFSRATLMALHRKAHHDDEAREAAYLTAPFHDRRVREVRVVERLRPVRSIAPGAEVSPQEMPE